MIKYEKMSLFDAPEGSILVHACNAQGVWGRGIAKSFKEQYPRSFAEYKRFCDKSPNSVGKSWITSQENKRKVGCLITSFSYGSETDDKDQIIAQTYLSLDDFCEKVEINVKIYSNKFNSGLFGVPWEETERALKYFVDRYDLDWTVCEV